MKILKAVVAVLGLAGVLSSLAADAPGGWALSLGPGTALDAARRLFSGATQEADGSLMLAQLTLTHAPALMRSGCDRMPRTRNEHFEDRYRWNSAQKRYLHEGDNSDRLDRWNDQHR